MFAPRRSEGHRPAFALVVTVLLLASGAAILLVPPRTTASARGAPLASAGAVPSTAGPPVTPRPASPAPTSAANAPIPRWFRDAVPVAAGHGPSPAVASPVSYDQARSSALAAVVTAMGGSWYASFGAGEALPTPEAVPTANLSAEVGCPLSWLEPRPSYLELPSTPESAAPGLANLYLLYFVTSDGNTSVAVTVTNGSAVPLFSFSSYCRNAAATPPWDGYAPSDILDSPAAVALANASGGALFLSDHPEASRTWVTYPAPYEGGVLWEIEDGGACGGFFAADLYAVNGTVAGSFGQPNGTCQYPVNFTETGLTTGTSWSVDIYGVSYPPSANATVATYLANGTHAFSIGIPTGYNAVPSAGSVTVHGAGVTEPILFDRVSGYHAISFEASGLADGRSWTVAVSGVGSATSFGAEISFLAAAGSYSYTISAEDASASPSSGTVTVGSLDVDVPVALAGYPSITFEETGLPFTELTWNATFSGAAGYEEFGTEEVALAPAGTYSFHVLGPLGFTATPATGSTTLAATNATVSIVFARSPGFYAVRFHERGLPAAAPFTVYVGSGGGQVAAPWNITTTLSNGSYAFTAEVSGVYDPTPATGWLVVSGSALLVNISFAENYFQVRFVETGLAFATLWTVDLNGTNYASTSPVVDAFVLNGTYNFSVAAENYTADPAHGTVTVAGALVVVPIVFRTVPQFPVTFDPTGPSDVLNGRFWNVTLLNATLNESTLFGYGASPLVFYVPNGSYSFRVSAEPAVRVSPANGTVNVSGAAATVTIAFSAAPGYYAVRFAETGLPPNTTWEAQLGSGTSWSTSVSITFLRPNGTYAFEVGTPAPFRAAPAGGNLTVAGARVIQNVTFTLAPGYYPVTFQESGLPAGTVWAVVAFGPAGNGSSTALAPATNTVFLANGTFAFDAYPTDANFRPGNGTLTVLGAALTVAVAFPAWIYTLRFNETGLPSGDAWGISLEGVGINESTAPSVTFVVANGSYPYSVRSFDTRWAAPNGTAVVAGASVTVDVPLREVTYAVSFEEAGLPAGTPWTVTTLVGTTSTRYSGVGTTIVAPLPNGTSSYTVGSSNLSWGALGGSVAVAGAATSVAVTFTQVTYLVTFAASGLAPGAAWDVNVSGVGEARATGGTITFELSNGTYAYTVGTASSVWVEPSGTTGAVEVDGGITEITVRFAYTYAVVFDRPSGVAAGTRWSVSLTGTQVFLASGPLASQRTESSTDPTITFYEPNGTYGYTVLVFFSSGYSDTGEVTVSGAGTSVRPAALPSGPSGSWLVYAALGAVVAGVAVLLVALAVRSRRRPPAAATPPGSGPGVPASLPPKPGAPGP